jgi:SSU ribosomal protein S8P
MMTDPIADMLTRIRNAHLALHKEVSVPRSKIKESIAHILVDEGYVDNVSVEDRDIKIALKYVGGRAVISGLKRISKPGRRIYVNAAGLPNVQNGLGICIVSTSKGVISGKSAKDQRIGGELICEIW